METFFTSREETTFMSHKEKTNPLPFQWSKINDATNKAKQGRVEYATEALCFLHSWRIANVLLIQLCRGRLLWSGLWVLLDCVYIFDRNDVSSPSSPAHYSSVPVPNFLIGYLVQSRGSFRRSYLTEDRVWRNLRDDRWRTIMMRPMLLLLELNNLGIVVVHEHFQVDFLPKCYVF